MSEPRFWQTDILFEDGKTATLTIQSEKGRSDHNERNYVLQVLGGIRASKQWQFNFIGSPREMPDFVPDSATCLLVSQMPCWLCPAHSVFA